MGANRISRRRAISNGLKVSMAAIGGFAFTKGPFNLGKPQNLEKKKLPFRVSLNTSTISAYNLAVDEQIRLVAAAGFDGIEIWMRDIVAFLERGGTTSTLRNSLQKSNLVLENIIGFAPWCSDDPEERKNALAQMRKEMQITSELGGSFLAAPILGIKNLDCGKLKEYVDRYNDILALKEETNVIPLLELWGTGALNKLADCAQIVIATGHPDAAMLLDFYHLYRGGSGYETLDCLNGNRLPVIHINDFPASPVREKLTDADRIFPGDGICPFEKILPKLYESGFRGGLSVELFNKHYWTTMDAETILKNSYQKTASVIENAGIKVL